MLRCKEVASQETGTYHIYSSRKEAYRSNKLGRPVNPAGSGACPAIRGAAHEKKSGVVRTFGGPGARREATALVLFPLVVVSEVLFSILVVVD